LPVGISLVTCIYAVEAYGVNKGIVPFVLASELDRSKRSASLPGRFAPGKWPVLIE